MFECLTCCIHSFIHHKFTKEPSHQHPIPPNHLSSSCDISSSSKPSSHNHHYPSNLQKSSITPPPSVYTITTPSPFSNITAIIVLITTTILNVTVIPQLTNPQTQGLFSCVFFDCRLTGACFRYGFDDGVQYEDD